MYTNPPVPPPPPPLSSPPFQFQALSSSAVVLSLLPPVLIQWQHYRWAHHMLDSRAIWWAGDRHLVPMLVRP
jgi:hypothetical protein